MKYHLQVAERLTPEMKKQVSMWVVNTIAEFGRHTKELLQHITIEWNPRFTRRFGDAELRVKKTPYEVVLRFSPALWPLVSEKERYETVVHEVCHILDAYFRLKSGAWRQQYDKNPHGRTWQKLMRYYGIEPAARYKVADATDEFKKNFALMRRPRGPRRQYMATCGCGSVKTVGPTRYARMQKGKRYICRLCKQQVRVM
jgi:predicted SprT family Zn-dependent metalloprotease